MFTATIERTLTSIIETFIRDTVNRQPNVKPTTAFFRLLETKLPFDLVLKIKVVLLLLSTSIGCFLLSFSFKPFHTLSHNERECIMRRWALSHYSTFRGLYKVFKTISGLCVYGTTDSIQWAPLHYPGPDPNRPPASFFEKHYTPVFESSEKVEYECDVVIIGSGCGGGVVAAELSEEGYSVIVLERGIYKHPSTFSLEELSSFERLAIRGGALTSEELSINIFAGETFGGGSTLNWSASLRTPMHVRKEWAHQHGLDYFVSDEYSAAMDAVCQRLGVSVSGIEHNVPNKILIEGCKALGIHYEDIPQNTRGENHACGWCCFGCPYGEKGKQSSVYTFLKDAQMQGAKFIKECCVEHVLQKNGKVIGVEASLKDEITGNPKKVFIKAKRVVCSAGSIYTPILLKKSGLKNAHIGKNLRLHPVVATIGIFPDRLVNSFEGSIMTSVSKSLENVDQKGYGCLIETPAYHPSIANALMDWKSASDHSQFFTNFSQHSPLIALCRDYDSIGQVKMDRNGLPRIHWTLSEHDANSLIMGVEQSIKILIAAGASEVRPAHSSMQPFRGLYKNIKDLETIEFKEYISRIKNLGLEENSCTISSAHQMGTCRLSTTPEKGVCDPTGQTWEVQGLYVADASLFPTASGVKYVLYFK